MSIRALTTLTLDQLSKLTLGQLSVLPINPPTEVAAALEHLGSYRAVRPASHHSVVAMGHDTVNDQQHFDPVDVLGTYGSIEWKGTQ